MRECGATGQTVALDYPNGTAVICPACDYDGLPDRFGITKCDQCLSVLISDAKGVRERIVSKGDDDDETETITRPGRIIRDTRPNTGKCVGCGNAVSLDKLHHSILQFDGQWVGWRHHPRTRFVVRAGQLVRVDDTLSIPVDRVTGLACEGCRLKWAGRETTLPYRHTTDDNDVSYGAFNRGDRKGRVVRSENKRYE